MKRMKRILHVTALIFLPIFISFCASTSLPPLSLNPATPLESDEKQIWESSLEEQGKLDKSEKIIQDPLMEEYLGRSGFVSFRLSFGIPISSASASRSSTTAPSTPSPIPTGPSMSTQA